MHVLLIGKGGREHALAWKLKQSARVRKLTCTPGNAGMAAIAAIEPAEGKNIQGLADLAEKVNADLTIVGPELPLVLGVADEFARRGLKIIGPSKAAAEIEGSKVFAKQFMRRHGIPTAEFGAFSDLADAYGYLCAVEWPVVIKADGLAGGKGVRIAQEPDEATAIIETLMEKRTLGSAGDRIVIEECLEGEELSFIVLTDGETVVPLAATRDYKRAFDDERGPNTGGMGAFSDDSILDPALRERILKEIVEPTLRGLKAEGRPYQGFLYCGLMLTAAAPKVLEFNCRMGDPECQPLMLRLESDLGEVLEKVAAGKLAPPSAGLVGTELKWSPEAAACVVLASGGYPGSFETGKAISGLEAAAKLEGVTVFHAGTKAAGSGFVSDGGRVLNVCARGPDLRAAVERAYAAAGKIRFEGMHYRHDIGARSLKLEARS